MSHKTLVFIVGLLVTTVMVFGQATATKVFVAHQGGSIGEATVSVDRAGRVTAASLSEWLGPSDWAEFNSPDGRSVVDGAVVRVPDPLANVAHADPAIRGHMFYIYQQFGRDLGIWSQFTPGREGFTRPTRFLERDFEGLMSNPIRAAAYVAAAKADTLVNVRIEGLRVIVGKKASETVYAHMDKANRASVYMPISASSIGYRYNNQATLDFFRANPTANIAAFTMRRARVAPREDRNVDAAGSVATYTAADDNVFVVADVVTGATYVDFPHYAIELQMAYQMALAELQVRFAR